MCGLSAKLVPCSAGRRVRDHVVGRLKRGELAHVEMARGWIWSVAVAVSQSMRSRGSSKTMRCVLTPSAARACSFALALWSGCEAAHSFVDEPDAAPAPVAVCHAPEQAITLANGGGTGIAIKDDNVIFIDSGTATLQRVALGGGAPETLSSPGHLTGLAVAGDVAYVASEQSSAPEPQRGLYAIPLAAGDPALVLAGFQIEVTTTDATSAYFAGFSGDVFVFTPPSTTAAMLHVDKVVIRGLATNKGDVYAAAFDFSTPAGPTGVMTRVQKADGTASRLYTTTDLPNAIAVDTDGMYWSEQSASFGSGRIARADLDGRHVQTLVMAEASALALDDTYVYFLTDSLNRIPKRGGTVEVLVSGLEGAGNLVVSGKDAAWVNLTNRAMSETRPSTIQAVCLR